MKSTCAVGVFFPGLTVPSSIDRKAVELLLTILEGAAGKVAGTVLSNYHANSSAALLAANLLLPDGHVAATASLVDHDDEPISLTWSADRNGYGYFSPSAGWIDVPKERLALFRVNHPVLLASLLVQIDVASRSGATALIPEVLWEIGDARIGRRRQRVPIWFARRLSDRGIWEQVAEAARRRPTTQIRVLLTSTPASRLPEPTLPGHVIVPVRDVLGCAAGLAINPDILAALVDGAPPADVHERVHVSPSGQQLVINGNVTINFKSDIQIAIVRKLVQDFKDGKRFGARELLDHAQSSAKTLRQAFGAQRWAELEPHLKSDNGLWGFEP